MKTTFVEASRTALYANPPVGTGEAAHVLYGARPKRILRRSSPVNGKAVGALSSTTARTD